MISPNPVDNPLWRDWYEDCVHRMAGDGLYALDPSLLGGVSAYLFLHLPPGSFLLALLAGGDASIHAHALLTPEHQSAIQQSVEMLVPAELRGSVVAVDAWLSASHAPDQWENRMLGKEG